MPRPSFAPAPLAALSSADAPTSYQPTLFELRFGPRRNRKPTHEASPPDRLSPSRKRVKLDDTDKQSEGTSSSSDASYDTPTVAPLNGHRGPFHSITRPAFCDRYRIEDLPGADIFYRPDWIDSKTAERWRRELDALPDWYQPKLKVYGREITQSREICAYATEPGLELKYSGHPVEMHAPFPPLLNHIASLLSSDDCLGSEVRFNHCMLNRYDDGKVYIGKHSDNRENKVIVTVSLGADRSWIMERKQDRRRNTPAVTASQQGQGEQGERIKKRWILRNGSLLVMQGETQKLYTHEIPKELKTTQPRISITFRQLVYE
ncbi:uncharacterized protein PFL1_00191 [Pseudozyma flocculosa PF-1]|uniref:Fe2OG dioxygenase domain-containing protein n=1 Tax=Pseudozyma flocculosa TaxID=84751 RepID=A0A5C3ERY8_9BASI|nr:uncharacterized protein PFL1_00191 [Pseudozyma flocculosa PF-1]EPQ31993.1 hypothetical protein PFL1_00191 [Pseudozyma flocculosa PF-1]SPO35084.1 uncharacterized protein PSFLO_00555 [Pseudozyma flocculosa]